jgi:hypothetical protein
VRLNLHNLAFQYHVVEGIDDDRDLLARSHVAKIVFVDSGFQSIAANILDSEDRHARRRQCAGVSFLLCHNAVERRTNPRVIERRARLAQSCLRLSLACLCHVAASESRLLAGFHLIELLRAHRFSFVESLVTLQRRFRQGQIGIGCDQLLLGSSAARGRTFHGGSRLGVVDHREHLPSPNAVPCVGTNFNNGPHHLTR